jgi:hypothetical protein
VQSSLRRLWIIASGSSSSAGIGSNSELGQQLPASPEIPVVGGELQRQQPNCFFVTSMNSFENTASSDNKTTIASKESEIYLHTDLPPVPVALQMSALSLNSVIHSTVFVRAFARMNLQNAVL